MKTNVRYLFMILFTIIAVSAFTQVPPPPGGPGGGPPSKEEMVKMETMQLKQDLKLTDAQVTAVEKISLKYAGKMEEAFKTSNGDFETMRKKMEEIEKSKSEEYKKVFTAEQYTSYEKMVKERRQRGPGMQ